MKYLSVYQNNEYELSLNREKNTLTISIIHFLKRLQHQFINHQKLLKRRTSDSQHLSYNTIDNYNLQILRSTHRNNTLSIVRLRTKRNLNILFSRGIQVDSQPFTHKLKLIMKF